MKSYIYKSISINLFFYSFTPTFIPLTKMNISSVSPSQHILFPYFAYTLDSFNQIKAQIYAQKVQKEKPKQKLYSLQKRSSNQNYNSLSKQILLQKFNQIQLTPKKQLSEEISQYITDGKYAKKNGIQLFESQDQIVYQTPKPRRSITIRPLNKPKVQQQLKAKLYQNYPKYKKKNQNEPEHKNQQMQGQNKQQDRIPKKGLTYISKKLSILLRQKKRIKSSQLFSMPLFSDEEEQIQQQQPIIVQVKANPDQIEAEKQQKLTGELKVSKQRRNVRRRIYDSINVMVALGIIKKVKNQFIYIQQKDDITDQQTIIQQQQILYKKQDYLAKLQSDCLYKQQCLKYLTESYSKLKILRKINSEQEDKMNQINQNTFTSTQALNAAPQQKIQFPFILLQNGTSGMKIQLINQSQQSEPVMKKVNDWTDYLQVQNKNKQSEIQLIKVRGQNIKLISDVDCINLLSSLQVSQHAEAFEKNQSDVLRDYQIINNHKQKKIEQQHKHHSKVCKQ